MNVFGAFTFGSLIKTLVPGCVWLVALLLLWRDLHYYVPAFPERPSIAGQEQSALVLAVPAAILLGLLSNIVVFMGVNDRLVRNPVRRRNPELFQLFDGLGQEIRVEHWKTVACAPPALEQSFLRHADPEVLVLQAVGMEHLAYIREQYWYHMEFQMNLMLAVTGLLLALLGSPAVLGAIGTPAALWRGGIEIVTLGGLCYFLHRAALKNYHRHVVKMCTLIAAAICAGRKATPP